jgi:hypothetical protein
MIIASKCHFTHYLNFVNFSKIGMLRIFRQKNEFIRICMNFFTGAAGGFWFGGFEFDGPAFDGERLPRCPPGRRDGIADSLEGGVVCRIPACGVFPTAAAARYRSAASRVSVRLCRLVRPVNTRICWAGLGAAGRGKIFTLGSAYDCI